MTSRIRKFLRGNKKFQLLLTLELAVMLPALGLILTYFHGLKSLERNKVLEAAIHRDFQEMLAISEKKINEKIYGMVDGVRNEFPTPETESKSEKEEKLDHILASNPWLAHTFYYDGTLILRSQSDRMDDKYFCEEHEGINRMFAGWFGMEGKLLFQQVQKRNRQVMCYSTPIKRPDTLGFITTAFFVLPNATKDHPVLCGALIEPSYLTKEFFPEMLGQLVADKTREEGGNKLAMAVLPYDGDDAEGDVPLAATEGWSKSKPEVIRKLDDVFPGLTLGLKFQGTTVYAISQSLVHRSFLMLGVLSLMMVAGLYLAYRNVSREMALARLKSDFVSNVSHELRTPLALIRLYAETLELGRIKTTEKMEEYYRIIRKESERLTSLINNILDFSRIEAGGKEYDFRLTDVAELVRNTLDSYRYQIEQQGFTYEEDIEPGIPPVRIDREAIARALVNLINNALKYSDENKFLRVRLFRSGYFLKLEVTDRGIGITRQEQSKIFEKFYRAGDTLVHNTRGSGLGLSLVRHITRAHGGDVEVESIPGKGSKFTLALPLAEPTG